MLLFGFSFDIYCFHWHCSELGVDLVIQLTFDHFMSVFPCLLSRSMACDINDISLWSVSVYLKKSVCKKGNQTIWIDCVKPWMFKIESRMIDLSIYARRINDQLALQLYRIMTRTLSFFPLFWGGVGGGECANHTHLFNELIYFNFFHFNNAKWSFFKWDFFRYYLVYSRLLALSLSIHIHIHAICAIYSSSLLLRCFSILSGNDRFNLRVFLNCCFFFSSISILRTSVTNNFFVSSCCSLRISHIYFIHK